MIIAAFLGIFLLLNLYEFRQSSKAVLSFPRSKIGMLDKNKRRKSFSDSSLSSRKAFVVLTAI